MSSEKTLCALPFMAADQHNNIYRPCCQQQDPGWSQHHTIDQYWNSDTLKKLRNDLSTGTRNQGCNKCWQLEDMGVISMRQAVNLSRLSDDIITCPELTQVKLITGKTCNISCMMCFSSVSSTYSTTWSNDKTWTMPEIKQKNLDYDNNMDEYIRSHADQLQYIEVLGGEPMFNKRFFELLDHLIQTQHSKNITLFVITNGTIYTLAMREKFLKFKKVVFVVSVDGTGLVNDYQRWPSRWSKIRNNLQKFADDFDVSIMPTVTAVNIVHLGKLYDFCQRNKYVVNNAVLVDHWPQLLPKNLPKQLKHKVPLAFRQLTIGDGDTDSLIQFIARWDTQRKISIKDYLPEWQSLT